MNLLLISSISVLEIPFEDEAYKWYTYFCAISTSSVYMSHLTRKSIFWNLVNILKFSENRKSFNYILFFFEILLIVLNGMTRRPNKIQPTNRYHQVEPIRVWYKIHFYTQSGRINFDRIADLNKINQIWSVNTPCWDRPL
jgi:hypothetical protein